MQKKETIRIRYAQKYDLGRLQKFFGRVYRPNHIFSNMRHLRWNFAASKFSRASASLPAVLAEDTLKNIVGFLGIIPTGMWIGGKKYQCGWFASLIVAKESRGKGIGKKLFRRATADYELPLAVSFSNIAYPMYIKDGWDKIVQYQRRILVLNAHTAALVANIAYPGRGAAILKNKKFLLSPDVLKNNNTNIRIRWGIPKEKAWTAAWPSILKRFGMTTDRPWQYLVWRFFKHPFIRYHVATAYDASGNIKGMAVVRIEKAFTFSLARIVDIVSLPEADIPLITSAILLAKKKKCVAIDTYLTFQYYIDVLKKFGFQNGRARPLYVIPELFNPPAPYSLNPIRWTMLAKLSKIPKKSFPSVSARHFVKANGDRDRA